MIRNTKRGSGFTLIELLVVIAIIGLLASVVLASLNSARIKSRDAKRLQEIQSVRTALEMFYSDNGRLPDSNDGLNDGWYTIGVWDNALDAALENGGYFSQTPSDPSSDIDSAVYAYFYDAANDDCDTDGDGIHDDPAILFVYNLESDSTLRNHEQVCGTLWENNLANESAYIVAWPSSATDLSSP